MLLAKPAAYLPNIVIVILFTIYIKEKRCSRYMYVPYSSVKQISVYHKITSIAFNMGKIISFFNFGATEHLKSSRFWYMYVLIGVFNFLCCMSFWDYLLFSFGQGQVFCLLTLYSSCNIFERWTCRLSIITGLFRK